MGNEVLGGEEEKKKRKKKNDEDMGFSVRRATAITLLCTALIRA
jgi:hypothetical protein